MPTDAEIEALIPMARSIAHNYTRRTPWLTEDAKAEACLALVAKAQGWRSDGGASLRSFCYPRVTGAVLDFLRIYGPEHRLRRGTSEGGYQELGLAALDLKQSLDGLVPSSKLRFSEVLASREPSPEKLAEVADLARVLLGECRDNAKLAIMQYLEGHELRDASRAQGMSDSWAKTILRNASGRVRRRINSSNALVQ